MIDLDAARAARREVLGEAPTVTFGGREFSLPAELPFPVVLSLGELADESATNAAKSKVIGSIVAALFGDRYDEFLALGPSLPDLEALLDELMASYGVTPGESLASVSS